MAAIVAGVFAASLSPFSRHEISPATGKFKAKRFASATVTRRQSVSSIERPKPLETTVSENGRVERKQEAATMAKHDGEPEDQLLSLEDYFEQSKEMIRSDGGPPRWFSPLECGSRLDNSPLLLFLPGIDGVGLGLSLHHQRLGQIFDIWCLHIPFLDRTPFSDLVELVGRTVRSENCLSPNRPIYLVGESVGACVALSVAARNPDIDLILILANPATCFRKSQLQPLIPLLQFVPQQLDHTLPYILSLMTGIPLKMVMATVEKRLPLQQMVREISESVGALPSYLSMLWTLTHGLKAFKLEGASLEQMGTSKVASPVLEVRAIVSAESTPE